MHIEFVCTGNTCRSPMAQGLFEKILKDNNTEGITCSSFGLSAFPGDSVSPLAVEAVKKYGVDISAHRSRRLSVYALDKTDVFVCMTDAHRDALKKMLLKDNKAQLLSLDVADPYGGGSRVYNECAAALYEKLNNLVKVLSAAARPAAPGDAEKIEETEKECFDKPWTLQSIKNELSNKTARYCVLEYKDEIIAYIGVNEIEDEAYISNIAVNKKFRRMHAAQKLLNFALEGAFSRGCSFITLEVRQSNLPAVSLYYKTGFEPEGIRKDFYSDPKEDALIMTLRKEKQEEKK